MENFEQRYQLELAKLQDANAKAYAKAYSDRVEAFAKKCRRLVNSGVSIWVAMRLNNVNDHARTRESTPYMREVFKRAVHRRLCKIAGKSPELKGSKKTALERAIKMPN